MPPQARIGFERRTPTSRVGAAAALALVVLTTRAARAEDHAWVWLVNDNDIWVRRGTDVDYSNGLELHVAAPLRPAQGMRWLLVGGAIGQAIYTPPDLRETRIDVLRRDRPYAGWLWGKASIDTAWSGMRLRVDLRGGVVGPHAYAEQSQTAWHKTNRAPNPQGWGVAQLGDQLDLALRPSMAVRALRVDVRPTSDGAVGADLTAEATCEVGSLRILCGAGPLLRVGWLRSAATSTAATQTSPIEPPLSTPSGERPHELFAWAAGEVRHAARDRTLDGDVCTATGCGPTWVTRAPWSHDVIIGVGGTHRGWTAVVAYVFRSTELLEPAQAVRGQRFGRLALGKAW